jgi:protein-disulfide isomerase/uncharacterized membrane protein
MQSIFQPGTPDTVTAPQEGIVRRPPLAGWRVALLLLISLANAGVSGLLLLQHHGNARAVSAVNQVCGAESGCDQVAKSPYAEVRGIPLAALGVAFSLSLAVLFLLAAVAGPETRSAAGALALVALALALLLDVVLLGVQFFAIKASCRLCLVTYLLNGLSLALLLPVRRDGAVLGDALARVEGRVAFTGALLAILGLSAGVLAGSAALRPPAPAEATSPLGLDTAPPRPSLPPAAPGSEAQRYQEEARVAQEQARRLQEILDDPQKLDQYMAQKAAREFEQGPVNTLDLKGVPYKGPLEAPIRVVEFSDFLCPYCRQIAGAFNAYVPQSGNRVAIYFKNYPLEQTCSPKLKQTIHPGACALALGAHCANDQGRFWAYHDRVFGSPPKNPQAADIVAVAREIGADVPKFEACLGAPQTRERLAAEIAEANTLKVDATPTLFINGKRLSRTSDFLQMVEREAARLGLPPVASAGHP